jgi:CubicO group peptidase (beta-lactamase class C family)
MLTLALLGAAHPLLRTAPVSAAAMQQRKTIDSATDRALAAIAADPACLLASLSVLAIRDGRPLYQFACGQRSIGASLPANADTLYRIASVSKLITTIGLMRLVEAGQLDIDADVSRYLGFSLRNPHFKERAITLRSLLTHTSSLRDDAGYSWPLATSLSAVFAGGGAMWSPDAGPGAFFTYCNLGWGVIGTIMERVSGERFDRLMNRLVLAPLGIHGGYNPSALPAGDVANIATIYRKRTVDTEVWNSAGPWIAQVDDFTSRAPQAPAGIDTYVPGANATPFSPTGGLRISAAGLGVVMRMLMEGGVCQGTRLLKRETVELIFTRQWTFDSARSNGDTSGGLFQAWGLGNQQFIDAPGKRLIEGAAFDACGHLGDAYGLRSMFVFDRTQKTGFVVLTGGTSSDPDAVKGSHSALAAFEERILAALWERTRHA